MRSNKPNIVLENEEVKIHWNRDIITNKTIPHYRPDIALTPKHRKTRYLIDISIPNTTSEVNV